MSICYDMLWYAMICYDMLWYVMICYDMLWYVISVQICSMSSCRGSCPGRRHPKSVREDMTCQHLEAFSTQPFCGSNLQPTDSAIHCGQSLRHLVINDDCNDDCTDSRNDFWMQCCDMLKRFETRMKLPRTCETFRACITQHDELH